ncbi:hypothetical protein BVC71_00295 [Marivivens niveibacter]|uniref:PepSY domain-containing protein n=1 Tax=Marivivens niveibacter TaxID=1930667 RepID=A0A251X0T1_9RHOB|nr:hypothetical protein [Marivivens niveibacter]OUD09998.1 hypothetical protein BVC71_00295 [Marivivens niveibacter]
MSLFTRVLPTVALFAGVFAAPVQALTVTEAITAAEEAGYSVVAVRTSPDGTVVSVLATDGSDYYDIEYDTTSAETVTTTVDVRDDATAATSEDVAAAIAAAEAAGYTVVSVRSTDSGVSVLATDGETLYDVDYDSATGTATTETSTRPARHHGGRPDRDVEETDSTETTDESDETRPERDDRRNDRGHGGRGGEKNGPNGRR